MAAEIETRLEQARPGDLTRTDDGRPHEGIFPRRLFRGSLSRTILWELSGGRESSLHERVRADMNVPLLAQEAHALCLFDGETSVADALAATAEIHGEMEPAMLMRHLEQLAHHGLVEIEERSR